jgi:hypothetical protein
MFSEDKKGIRTGASEENLTEQTDCILEMQQRERDVISHTHNHHIRQIDLLYATLPLLHFR